MIWMLSPSSVCSTIRIVGDLGDVGQCLPGLPDAGGGAVECLVVFRSI
jgi:hypothetical protein